MRMRVGRRGMFVCELAMFVSRSCVLLGFFVFADSVVMLGLMMMMVSGRLVMMLTGWMLRWLCHVNVLLVLAGIPRMFDLPKATLGPSNFGYNGSSIDVIAVVCQDGGLPVDL